MKTNLPIKFFILLSLFVSLAMTGWAEASEAMEPPILSVSGSGRGEAEPDQASVALGVTTRARTAQAAQNENASRAASVQAALKALGIQDKCIQTQGYSFHPTYRQNERHQNELDGYAVDNTVLVTVNDINLVGKAIDAALRNGANQVNSLSFTVKDTKALRREALAAAIADAREKADIIAAGLGHRIVGIRSVSESSGRVMRQSANMMMMAKAEMADAAMPIEPGTVELEANVHIDFILSR